MNRFAQCLMISILAAPMQNALAETDFVADILTYDTNNENVYVEGNVEIKNEQGYFYLEKLIYDIKTGRIEINGNVRGVLTTGEKIIADYALLDPKTRVLVLQSARIYLQSEMQIAASYATNNDQTTYGENVVASNCAICAGKKYPLWQIEANQVVRDKEAQKIYFKDALFRLFGLPIAYAPKFRVPGPEATRMSGFLTPRIRISDLYSVGLKMPYYHAFSEYSDILVTPYLTTNNVAIVETTYRQNLKGTAINVEGAVAANDGKGGKWRYYLYPRIKSEIFDNWYLEASYHISSDYDFASDFSYSNPNKNFVDINYSDNSQKFLFEMINYRPVNEKSKRRNYPRVLPHINYENVMSLGAQTTTKSEFDIGYLTLEDEFEYRRISAETGISHQMTSLNPFIIEASAGASAQIYDIDDYINGIHGRARRAAPYMTLDATLPMVRVGEKGSEYLTPRVQFIASKNYEDGVEIPNRDALFVEHDYVSLFALNRYSGNDLLEEGLRLNVGATYSRIFENNNYLDTGFGRVFRINPKKDLTNFKNQTQNGGEWVGYANYVNTKGFSVYGRGAWDDDLDINRAEIGVNLSNEKLELDLDIVHLAPEPEIALFDPRASLNFNGSYLLAGNWLVDFGASYDIQNDYIYDYSIGLKYGNECVEASMGFTKDYTRGDGIEPETEFEFGVTFIGLGDNPDRQWARSKCAKF